MALHLELESFHYPGSPALFAPVTLTLEPGHGVALVGSSGSGKTSLLTLLARLHPQPLGGRLQGVLRIDEEELNPARLVGYLGSDPEAFLTGFCATVLEEVGWTLFGWGWGPEQVEERVRATLRQLELEELTWRDPRRLSGGQQQMVALAAVWARQPRYLLLDEPVSKLDPQTRQRLMTTVTRLVQDGVGVVWATANLGEVRWCDTVWSLSNGVVQRASAAEWVPGREGAVPPWPRRWAELWRDEPPPWTSLVLARNRPFPAAPSDAEQSCAVEVSKLSYRPPGHKKDLFQQLDWRVPAAQITGLIGPNGAGKTTLARLLRGLLNPGAGQIRVQGRAVGERPLSELASTVAYTFQDPGNLFLRTRVDAELLLSGELLGLSREEAVRRCHAALQLFGLEGYEASHPRELPATAAALLGVAISWYSQARVQILDEPLARLDLAGRQRLEAVLRSWRDDGVTVILIAHDLDWLLSVCQSFTVLDEGAVLIQGAAANVFAHPRVVEGLGAPLPLLAESEPGSSALGIPDPA